MLSLLLCVCLIPLLFYVLRNLPKNNRYEKIPRLKGNLIFGNTFEFLMDYESLFYHFVYLTNKYKDVFDLKVGNKHFVILNHPEDVETIISGTKYNEKGFLYFVIRPWLRDGLLLSSGKKWYQRRKLLTPTFHFKILRHFNDILIDKSKELVDSLHTEIHCSRTNFYTFLTDFTINSICETAMGTNLTKGLSKNIKVYKNAIHKLGTYIIYRCSRPWLYPQIIFNFSHVGKKQKKTLELLSSFRDHVIGRRRQNGILIDTLHPNQSVDNNVINDKKRLAMLDLLLAAEHEGLIDSKGINEEVDTFMFEGHDTTASALNFAFMLLANHPDDQDKIVEERLSILGSSDHSKPTLSDLSKMKYLEACIKESLRLYPPVPFIVRKGDESLKIRDTRMTSGTSLTILIFNLHRRSDQFVEPLKFRPERFLKEPTWHPFAYIPFSAGQRNCIGQKFAMMEMKLAISMVLSQYRLLPITRPQDLIFTADIILRTKNPIYVKFEKR